MADTSISGLPAGTTPDADDLLAAVQSGVTNKITRVSMVDPYRPAVPSGGDDLAALQATFDAAQSDSAVVNFPTGVQNYRISGPLEVGGSTGIDGFSARLFALDTTSSLLVEAGVEQNYRGIQMDGDDVATGDLAMIQFGTGNQGAGSKLGMWSLHAEGAAGTAVGIIGLQNSTLVNCRIVDCNASAGPLWLIDEGSKNINLFGCYGSSVHGRSLLATTTGNMVGPGNAQRTSKVTVVGGLFERSDGWELQDVEEFTAYNVILNANALYDTSQALLLVAGGNRDGSAHGPTGVLFQDCQFKDWDIAVVVDGPYEYRTANCSMGSCGTNYQITHEAAKILELGPPQSDAPIRYDDGATGVIEQHAVRRLYYTPNRIPVFAGTATTWTNMPSASTELFGVESHRVWADIWGAKFIRLGAHVTTVGAAGSKLRLHYQISEVGFANAQTRLLGTDEIQLLDLGGATAGTYTLTYSGQTTAAIAFDATAAQIQAALVALSNISANGAVVDDGQGDTYTITFGAEWAGQPVATITVTDSTTGGTGVTVTTNVEGVTTEVPISATGTVKSDWVTIADTPLDAIDILLLVGGVTGDGAADPVISSVYVELC